tara:strand:- start:1173 stop:1358 length:186 start_codon:yes stop_codon:yes gene_type:complete
MPRIKMMVSTGWANGEHVDYCELPCHWDNLTDSEKETWVDEAAHEYLLQVCSSCGEIVEDD